MARTLTLHPHLTTDALFTAYKTASDPATARRWHALWLSATGRSAKDAAAIVGLSADWLRDLVHRYNQQGPGGLQDRRAANPGKAPRLSPHQQQALATLLAGPAPDGGLWSGPKVAAWIAEQTGQPALPQLGWDYLRRLGFTVQAPRPRHPEAATPEAQEAWKNPLHDQVDVVSAAHPQATVEVWYQDEARLGLKPIVRRVWARRGQRPRVPSQTRYEWLYVYGFVHPERGETYWLLVPTVSIEAMSLALREFARDVGVGATKQVVLVLDQAGWHTSGKVVVPEGITLMPLPAKTPELQPAERLWPLVREGVANRAVPDVDALQERLVARCLQLRQEPDQIRALTRYHWLPAC